MSKNNYRAEVYRTKCEFFREQPLLVKFLFFDKVAGKISNTHKKNENTLCFSTLCTPHKHETEVYRGVRFTLGVLETSCLHSWGLRCTCHFSLWGKACLRIHERQEAIIKECNTESSHTHIHTHDNSHTRPRRKQPLF